jgi:hypothetical protein
MMRTIITGLTLALALAGFGWSQAAGPYSLIVIKAELDAVAPDGDFGVGELAVNPTTGIIYAVDDTGPTGATNSILRIDPGTPNTVTLLADITSIIAAIDAADGTTGATEYEILAMDVADDGDLIAVGFTNADDTVVSITDAGAISVVHTSVDGGGGSVNGASSLTVIGNTVYVGLDDSFGPADDLVTLDSNDASAPSAAVTTLVTQATLEALPNQTPGEVALNALNNDGTDIIGVLSEAATSNDDIVRITPAGVVTIEVGSADVIADLQALDPTVTDVGFGAIAVDGDGDLWLPNPFGDGSYDAGVLQIANITPPTGDTTGVTGASLEFQLGLPAGSGPFLANDSFTYDALNDRILFGEGDTNGIVAVNASPPLVTSVTAWHMYR